MDVATAPVSRRFHPRIGMFVGVIRGVIAFFIPHVPLEVVHPVDARFDRGHGVLFCLIEILIEREEPFDAILTSVADQLTPGETVLGRFRNDGGVAQIQV